MIRFSPIRNAPDAELASYLAGFGIVEVNLADAPMALWRLSLDTPNAGLGSGSLDDFERERASRLSTGWLSRRYIAAHAAVRTILAAYTGVQPHDVRIDRLPTGKPVIANMRGLHFSLSHSDAVGVVAVAFGNPVGVDVELVRPVGASVLERMSCTPREIRALARLRPSTRDAAFLSLWTAKEAFLKAQGVGLATDPRTIDAWDILQYGHFERDEYDIRPFVVAPEYIGAFAFRSNSRISI
jgi:4'-phosphopantetheinyl transferase